MSAHETGAKTILLGREMGRDEGKDIQRDSVYVNERVPPLANSRQCGRGILVELGNTIESEAMEEVSVSFSVEHLTSESTVIIFRNIQRRMCHVLQLLVQSEDEL
jgi:hypothetical protein